VNFEDIQQAAERIRPYVHRTPVMTSRTFEKHSAVKTFFKCENLQRGGAFKLRGAVNFIQSIPDADIKRGVVAFSSGNHAQAVAIAASIRGTKSTLVMPHDAPVSKAEATQGYGGFIVRYDRMTEDREPIGRRISEESGATLVPPFDHPWIIAGQGTAAMELLEDSGNLDAIIAPVGGGGLLSGTAMAAKAMHPSIRVIGAEPARANDWALSMEAGHPVEIAQPDTIADGLRSPKPGKVTFPIVKELVERIILVTEDEILAAMKFLLTRMKLLVEPSGAVSAAVVLSGKLPPGIQTVGVILSGGNVDLDVVRTL